MAQDPPKKPSWLNRAQSWAEGAQKRARQNVEDLSEQLSREEAWTRLRSAARDTAKRAQTAAQGAGETAQKLIASLGNAPRDLDDPLALASRFEDALISVESQVDREANAVAIGYLGGGGAGVAGLSGTEVFYLRPDGPLQAHLRVSQVVGREARLSVAASTGAYVACFYGPREALARPGRRRGADVEVLVASLGFLRLTAGDRRASGWVVGLSAGVGLGIPILSSFSALDLDEQPIGGVKLTGEESSTIEEVLRAAPDRAWRRRIALAL